MLHVQQGQCGLCRHFGNGQYEELAQIRQTGQAREDLVAMCHHTKHADLHLKVTPISSCDGFEPANETAEAA
jgi:hypothetical protein